MRKTLSGLGWLALIVLLIQSITASSANAVFGLGACEKVKKAITAEEKIGLESWKTFRKLALNYEQKPPMNVNVATALLDVLDSDKTVMETAKKNPKCYTTKQNAEIRRNLGIINQNISYYSLAIKDYVFLATSYRWSQFYPQYIGVYQLLAKVK